MDYNSLIKKRNEIIDWADNNIPKKRVEKEKKEPFINTERSLGYFVSGKKGTGKSSFLSYLAELYFKMGYLIIDFYSESDYENCYWIIKEKRAYKCIFIIPRYVTIEIPDKYKDLVKVMYDDEGLEKIIQIAQEEKRIIVFVNSCYEEENMLQTLSNFFDELPRLNDKLNLDIFLIIRELSHLAPQSLKIFENATKTKRSLLKLVAGCRHHRISFAMDMQVLTMLFKNIRNLYDRMVIKKTTPDMIPQELKWFLDQLALNRSKGASIKEYPPVHKLFPREYYGIYDSGLFFKDSFPLPSFHLKREKDNFQLLTGITFTINKQKLEEKDKKIVITLEEKRLFSASEGMRKKGMKGKDISQILKFPSHEAYRMWRSNYLKKGEHLKENNNN